MNRFDHFVKHKLKAKYYVRYADDFVIVSEDSKWLVGAIKIIGDFLWNNLRLRLHPKKISIRTVASGNDFLGWVHFPDHRVLRTVTKKRMLKKIVAKNDREETLQSYLGLLHHGNMMELEVGIRDMINKD